MSDGAAVEAGCELRCGLLLDGSGGPGREDVSVVLERGVVAAVTRWRDRSASHRREVLDFSYATVTPGLIDGHAHLCWGSGHSPGWAALPDDPAATVAWGFASGSAALAAGITTVVDCGSPSGLALLVRDLIDLGVACGPKVFAAGEAITTTGGHGAFIGTTADTGDQMRTAVRALVSRGADLIKVMVTGGATDPHTNRRQPQYSRAELQGAVEDAHRLGRLVVGHANATTGIVNAVHAGVDVIAHCNWLGADPGTIVVDMPTVEEMGRRGTYVDLNLQGARRSLAETDGHLAERSVLAAAPACRWDLLAPLRDAGVGIYLSSDAFGPAIGSFPADLGQAAAEWNMSLEHLIHRVTALPAMALGLADRGLIATGRAGDLAVYHGDLRSDFTLGTPIAVYRDGQLCVDRGRLTPPAVASGHRNEAAAQRRLLDEVFNEPQ